MGNKSKNEDLEVVIVEYKVSMYCNACERTVAGIISKQKGVETFTTDMNNHKVVVTGRVDPHKLLKKLKKKTGKRVKILANKKELDEKRDPNDDESYNLGGNDVAADEVVFLQPFPTWPSLFGDDCRENEMLLLTFSDENPNACSIM